MKRVLVDEEPLKALYDHQVNVKPTTGLGGMTLSGWGDENMRRRARMNAQIDKEFARKQWTTDPALGAEYVDRRRMLTVEMQLACVDQFKQSVHSSEITASLARRSIAKWYNDGVSRADEDGKPFLMSFPRDRVHDLSALGDALAGEVEELDTLFLLELRGDSSKRHFPTRSESGGPVDCPSHTTRSEQERAARELTKSVPHPTPHLFAAISTAASLFNRIECTCLLLLFQQFHVCKGHDRVLAKLLGALQIHIPFRAEGKLKPCGMHLNFVTQSKEGSTGKTFQDETTSCHLIPNTFLRIDRITPQFLTGSDAPPDDDGYIQTYHKMVFFMDELQEGILEYNTEQGNLQSKFGAGHGSSISEMIKTVQTKGEYTWVGPILDSKGSAWRANGQIKERAEISLICCTNRSLVHAEHSSLSRNVIDYAKGYSDASTMDSNRPDVAEKMTDEQTPSPLDIQRKDQRIQRWHRNQFIASIVGQMIEGGVLQPIDISCTDQIWNRVRAESEKNHLSGLRLARNFDIFRALVQGLVLYELALRMFDIPAAPFGARVWTFNDVLWFQKHLVATSEHATIAFGIMRSSFENEGLMLTTRLLSEWALELHSDDTRRNRKQQETSMLPRRYVWNSEDDTIQDRVNFVTILPRIASTS